MKLPFTMTPQSIHAAYRYWRDRRERFPETPIARLPGSARALDRRRAKNKVARASRKRNRRNG